MFTKVYRTTTAVALGAVLATTAAFAAHAAGTPASSAAGTPACTPPAGFPRPDSNGDLPGVPGCNWVFDTSAHAWTLVPFVEPDPVDSEGNVFAPAPSNADVSAQVTPASRTLTPAPAAAETTCTLPPGFVRPGSSTNLPGVPGCDWLFDTGTGSWKLVPFVEPVPADIGNPYDPNADGGFDN